MALLMPPLRELTSVWTEKAAGILFEYPSFWRWGAIGLIAMPVLWLFRMPTHFLGDGYEVIGNLDHNLPVVMKWSEAGAVAAVHAVSDLLPKGGVAPGETAYALVSVLAGGISIILMAAAAYELEKDKVGRLFLFAMLLSSGAILLFFGYAENYPILWPFALGFIYTGVRYLNGKGSLLLPALLTIAAAALHLQALFFLAAWPVLLFARNPLAAWYRRHRLLAWVSLGAGLCIAGTLFVLRCQQSLAFRLHFLPLLVGRPAAPDIAVFSPTHLLDMANELTLVIPLWPVLVGLARGNWRGVLKDSKGLFLLLFSLGGFLFLAGVDPKLGMARDWDLFALTALGPLALLSYLAVSTRPDSRTPWLGLIVMACILTIPFVAANAGNKTSLDYFGWMMQCDRDHSKSGLVQLMKFYTHRGQTALAENLNRIMLQRFPETAMLQQAHGLLAAGKLDESMAQLERFAQRDPYSAEIWYLRGLIHLQQNKYDQAIADMKQVVELSPYDYVAYLNLANAYMMTKQPILMMECLNKARKLGPDQPDVLEAVAMVWLNQGRYDSAQVYGEKLIRADSTIPAGYLAAGGAAYNKGDNDLARQYLSRFVRISPPTEERQRAADLLYRIQAPQSSPGGK